MNKFCMSKSVCKFYHDEVSLLNFSRKEKKEMVAVARKKMNGVVKSDQSFMIDIKQITKNSVNPRNSAPILWAMGYGVFEKQPDSDKPALFDLAFSDDIEQQKEFIHLIDRYESHPDGEKPELTKDGKVKPGNGGILGLANSILLNKKQINPVQVRSAGEGVWDLCDGCRRVLAQLYNGIRSQTTPRVRAEINEDMGDAEATRLAIDANRFALSLDPVSMAKHFQHLHKALGKPLEEIEKETGVEKQTIKNRLKLLKLTPDEQEQVRTGELTQQRALQKLAHREGRTDTPEVAGTQGERRRAPSTKDWKTIYETGKHNDKAVPEEVRRWGATEVLGLKGKEYKTLQQIQTQKEKEEKAEAAAE
jgi:hypothetical protein